MITCDALDSGFRQWCEQKGPDDDVFLLSVAHMIKRTDRVFKSETDDTNSILVVENMCISLEKLYQSY